VETSAWRDIQDHQFRSMPAQNFYKKAHDSISLACWIDVFPAPRCKEVD
jgi:hypothetical protein